MKYPYKLTVQNFSLLCQDFDEHLHKIGNFDLQMNFSPYHLLR